MEWLDQGVHSIGVFLSRFLEPLAIGVEMLNDSVRRQLEQFGVPFQWQVSVVSILWTLVLFMLLRTLTGWVRLLAVAFVAIALVKIYGYLPSV